MTVPFTVLKSHENLQFRFASNFQNHPSLFEREQGRIVVGDIKQWVGPGYDNSGAEHLPVLKCFGHSGSTCLYAHHLFYLHGELGRGPHFNQTQLSSTKIEKLVKLKSFL